MLLSFFACKAQNGETIETHSQNGMSYLALGDSYTIGHKISEKERWPNQLAKALRNDGFSIQNPKIIAKNGWRTDELLDAMHAELNDEKYDLVSVMIGVNNQYQSKNLKNYKEELKTILREAIAKSKEGKECVFVLSIPDYGMTPFGKKKGGNQISEDLKKWNAACKQVSQEMGIAFYNITKISKQAETDSALVASDGLHPSGKMYQLWVEKILPKIEQKLKE